jgi:arginase
MTTRIGLAGVPTSAGSHNPGQEDGPSAWRAAGVLEALTAAGIDVRDYGDLARHPFQPGLAVDGARDLDRVLDVCRQTAALVESICEDGRRPLILGGDCTVTLGVVAGLSGHEDLGLIYLDGDVDLSAPASSPTGVLDTMGMTHLLGRGIDAFKTLGASGVALRADRIVLFGFDPAELDTDEWTQVLVDGLLPLPAPTVRRAPLEAATVALGHLDSCSRYLVHFDVDVLHTGLFPLANFPHFNGLSLTEVGACLERFLARPQCAGLVVTEVNPHHDPDGTLLVALRDTVVRAATGLVD